MNQKIVNRIGWAASLFPVLMLVGITDQILLNMQGKTGSLLSPFLAIINCMMWTVYGFFKTDRDWKIVIPNAGGIVLGCALLVSGIYCKMGCYPYL